MGECRPYFYRLNPTTKLTHSSNHTHTSGCTSSLCACPTASAGLRVGYVCEFDM